MANLSNINGKFLFTTGSDKGLLTVLGTTVQNSNTAGIELSNTHASQTVIFIENTTTKGYELSVGGSSNSIGAGSFYIYDAVAADARLVISSGGDTTFAGTVQINGSNATVINASDPNVTVSDTDTNYRGSMRWLSSSNVLEFFTRYAGTYYTNNLVLDRGNVAIGNSSPDILGYGNTSRTLSLQGIIGTASAQRPVVVNLAGQRDDGTDGYVSDINFLNMASNGTTVNSRAIMRMSREGADNSNRLEFWTALAASTTEKMRITSSGDIWQLNGANSTSAFAPWDVSYPDQGICINTPASGTRYFSFADSQTPSYGAGMRYFEASNFTELYSKLAGAYTTHIRLDRASPYTTWLNPDISGNTGNVGIGISTAPLAKLHLEGTGDMIRAVKNANTYGPQMDLILNQTSPSNGDTAAYINMGAKDNSGNAKYWGSMRAVVDNIFTELGGFEFYTRAATDFNKRLKISAQGKVIVYQKDNVSGFYLDGANTRLYANGGGGTDYRGIECNSSGMWSWGETGSSNYFAKKVGIGNSTPYSRLDVNGVLSIGPAELDPDFTVTNTDLSTIAGGSLELVQGFGGTSSSGDTIVFTYKAQSWKAFQYEYCISAAYGLSKGGGGGYNNNGMTSYYYVTTNQGSNVNVTSVVSNSGGSSNQYVVVTITGIFGIHPCVSFKYTQSGGDGAPRADRATLAFNS